jgi:hypothetical protein
MEKQLIQASAKCECGAEIMEVEYWKEEKSFCFTQFKYLPHFYNFKRRLKFLFFGTITFNKIILDHTNAKYIADYINENLKNYVEKEKER